MTSKTWFPIRTEMEGDKRMFALTIDHFSFPK